jgi:tetratricopeptide (TPR) repeat protein
MNEEISKRAREAAAQRQWKQAYDLLMDADASEPLHGPDLALLADVAYGAGQLAVTFEAWERAYADAVKAGEPVAAAGAATRVALHLVLDTALMAPVRGWVKRAERLLENHDETPVHAWLALVRSYERMFSGEFRLARDWARRAIELGLKHDRAAAAMGRIAEARSLILDGDVRTGLELLEESAVATVSGELDALSTGIVYCELVCALQAVAQYDQAEEWTQAMEQWSRGHAVGSVHGRCRVHRAEILRLRGCSCEAEKEALLACEELRPYLRREYGWPLTELGRCRLQTGDLEGAEKAFAAAHEAGWDPQPGPALVALARGDVERASAAIQNALEFPSRVPSKELPPNTELRLAPLLEAQVEIAIAAGKLQRAQGAAARLAQIATRFESKPLMAGAALARGRVRLAEGDTAGARQAFETAMTLWHDVGAPFEAAVARRGLAETFRAAGNHEAAQAEFRVAHAVFEKIGARLQAEQLASALANATGTASPAAPERRKPKAYAVRPGRPSVGQTESQPNIFRREGEYWSIGFDGETIRLRDAKGLHYIARLIREPGREFHVLDLVTTECGWPPDVNSQSEAGAGSAFLGDAGALLDPRAKEAYRRRLADIEDDIKEAQDAADVEREAQGNTEREILVRELSRAVGLGGRDRRAGLASERARASVTKAVRLATSRIREYSGPLAEHLDRNIRTGTRCVYIAGSSRPVQWRV